MADNYRDEVNRWNAKIDSARKWRDDICAKRRWKDLINEYKGQWDLGIDISVLPINLIFAYIKTELPSLYIKDPHIKINPKNKTSINTAKVLESVINYIWYYKKIKREIKKAIVDALLIGHAWFKTGYTGKFGSIEDGQGGTIETIESEDFFAYRLPWDQIVFDPDAIDPPYDCEWIAQSMWLPIEEVKRNPRYKNTADLQATYSKKDNYDNTSDSISDKNAGKCCLTEVWNIKDKTVFTLAEGVDDYIEEPKPWPYQLRGYPFSFLKFNFSNDDPFGISDVAIFEPQVLELIKVRSAALDHIKRFNRQLMTTPDNISDDEMNKITQGITASIAKVQDPTKVLPIPYPPLQTDVYALEERIKEDMVNESGQSPTERGATQKTSTRTKAELVYQRQGAENRRSEKIDLVEDFAEDIAGNIVGLVKQFATEPYYVRVLGVNSPELQKAVAERPSAQSQMAVTEAGGFTFTAEDIEGEYDVEVVAGSSTPLDRVELMKVVLEGIELAPKAGAIPGGPLMAAFANLYIELIDVPELKSALEAEQQAQAQMKQQQAAQAEEMKQLSLAAKGAESQIEATNAATKQNKVLVDFIRAMADKNATEKEVENESANEGQRVAGELSREEQKMNHQLQLDEIKLQHEAGIKEAQVQHEMALKSKKTDAEIQMMKKKKAAQPKKDKK
jgi:hypothetical protein